MSRENIREHVLDLMKEKERLEREISSLTAILSQNGVGMNDPLVDSDDFPISSIDIYQVRDARHKVICLQNDHKNVMKQIEEGLHGFYGTPPSSTTQQFMQITGSSVESPPTPPHAKTRKLESDRKSNTKRTVRMTTQKRQRMVTLTHMHKESVQKLNAIEKNTGRMATTLENISDDMTRLVNHFINREGDQA